MYIYDMKCMIYLYIYIYIYAYLRPGVDDES